mgnify:CR=1 FL=1|jgi:ABC-2 type transport system permease protein
MKLAIRIGLSRVIIELRQLVRDREAAFFTLAFPVVLIVIFGSVFRNQTLGDSQITFSQYFVAGMIASGMLYTSFQNLAISIPQERDEGALKRLQGLPMPKTSYFIGKIGLVFVTFIGQTAILILTGMIFFGIELPTEPAAWWRFTWISILGLTSCTLLGIAFSSVPKSGKGASAVVTPIVLVLQFTSGVFFFFGDLPSWMQNFAAVFPLKWLTQGMRSVFLPPEAAVLEIAGSFEIARTAQVLLIWLVIAAVLAAAGFRWNRRGEN